MNSQFYCRWVSWMLSMTLSWTTPKLAFSLRLVSNSINCLYLFFFHSCLVIFRFLRKCSWNFELNSEINQVIYYILIRLYIHVYYIRKEIKSKPTHNTHTHTAYCCHVFSMQNISVHPHSNLDFRTKTQNPSKCLKISKYIIVTDKKHGNC